MPTAAKPSPQTTPVRIAANGRMVLPRAAREALGAQGASTIFLTLEDGEVKLTSVQQNILRAQALYRQHVKRDRSTDDFLRERRAEAAREELDN